MATTVRPVTGGEAPVIPAAAAPEGSSASETVEQRRERAMALAATMGVPGAPGVATLDPAAADAAVAALNAAHEDPMGAAAAASAAAGELAGDQPAETDEEREVRRAALTEEQRAAEDALAAGGGAEGAVAVVADAPGIAVEIPVQGSETPFTLEVGDQETADLITSLVQRATRGDQSRAIREQAQQMRDEAEEFQLVVELDPAGVVQEAITDPKDIQHLFRYLATRPGVLQQNLEWVQKLLDDPDSLATNADLMELERMRRKESVQGDVTAKREDRQYNRALAGTIHKSMESLVPESLTTEARDQLYSDVMDDVRKFKDEHNLRTMDLRRVPGFIQRRLALWGHKPREAGQGSERTAPSGAAIVPTVPVVPAKPVVAPPARTVADLKAASANRQAAASAPAGPGGVANALPVRPAFDPKQPGTALQQSIAWARKTLLPSLTKKPL